MSVLEWDPIAPYYDYLFRGRTVDVPFWVHLAKRFGSPILELTCGTGRLTFPIANAGIHITGLDISAPMLRVAQKKRRARAETVRRRIHFIHGDATNFALPKKKFTAVFLPWGFIPVTHTEQEGIFRSIKSVLLPSGHVAIDIENSQEPTKDWDTIRRKERVKVPRLGMTLIRHAHNSGSAATKIGRIVYTLDIIRKSGAMKRLVTQRTYKIYTARDLKQLLVAHGFRIVRVYGDYDFSSWTPDAPQAIVVAKRSKDNAWSRIGDRLSALMK